MIDIHQERAKVKLQLWETPGFSQFLEDLIEYCGPESPDRENIEVLRKRYIRKLLELPRAKNKFKQTKLPL